MPKLLVQTLYFMLNPCFLSGSLEFWGVPGRGYLHDQLPVQTLSTELLMSFPDQNALLGEFGASRRTPRGEGSWKVLLVSSRIHPMNRFPLLIWLGILSL